MSVNDGRWDDSYKYIWYLDNGAWSTRFTAWYIPGLLHRNEGNDVANAQAALRNLYVWFLFVHSVYEMLMNLGCSISVQMNYNFSSAWYGDFKLSPDGRNPAPCDRDLAKNLLPEPNPTPNGALYPPEIYVSSKPSVHQFLTNTISGYIRSQLA